MNFYFLFFTRRLSSCVSLYFLKEISRKAFEELVLLIRGSTDSTKKAQYKTKLKNLLLVRVEEHDVAVIL
jgi:hypothetical protein